MTEAEKFAHRIQECAQNKDPITVFGMNYVLEEDYDMAVLASLQADRENAKLRELVESMASRLRWADEITGGGVLDARLKRQLREVGVEVDG